MKPYQSFTLCSIVLVIYIAAFFISCGTPVPFAYTTPENQEKIKKYPYGETIDEMQCDGIASFDVIIGPKEKMNILCEPVNCPILVKRERILSNGKLDTNHIQLDTLRANSDKANGHMMDIKSYNEYFKVTITCLDEVDGRCEPRIRIEQKK